MLDPATWSSDRFDGPRPPEHDDWIAELAAEEPELRELLALSPQALIALDPPDHTRLRNVLRRAFAPAAVQALRPLVEREVEALLPSDIDSFARALPFRVVMRWLEVPEPAWPELERLAHAASTGDTATEDRAALRARLLAERDVMRFFLAHRPARLRDDDTISPREAAGLCREVLVAGSESVAHVLAGALRAIARDGRPEDLEAFIEHRLAVDPPFTAFWRRATRPTTLAGVAIPQDGLVQLPYAQLNRDSARHLSFGHGIHFCLGAALARLELSVALQIHPG
jgi:cytochrome P450